MAVGDVLQSVGFGTPADTTSIGPVVFTGADSVGNTDLIFGSGDGIFSTPSGWTVESARPLNFTDAPLFHKAAAGTTESTTLTGNATTGYSVCMAEVQGAITYDVGAVNNVTATSSGLVATASITTTHANELLVAWASNEWASSSDAATAVSTGWTLLRVVTSTNSGQKVTLVVAYQKVASTGTYSATFTYPAGISGSAMAVGIAGYALPGGGTPATATGSLSLSGSASASATTAASGAVTLTGTATAAASPTATGALALTGTSTAKAAATASGSLTLSGAATTSAPPATGALTLTGAAAARAADTATGALSLTATAGASARPSAAGAITLAGTAAWTAPPAIGSLNLAATSAAKATAAASGSITLTGNATALGPWEAAVLADNPSAWWPLADPIGSPTAADDSGHAWTGTPTAVTFGATSLLAGEPSATAATFNGTTSQVDSALNPSFTAITVAVLFRSTGPNVGSANPRLIANDHTDDLAGDFGGFELVLDQGAGNTAKPWFAVGNGTTFGQAYAPTTHAIYDGQPHYVVGTYDGATVCIYLDGTLLTSTPFTGTVVPGSNGVAVGYTPTNGDDHFQGDIGQAVVYPSALSATRIAQLYTVATGAAPTTANGSLTLTGTAAAAGRATASGSLTLGGTASAGGRAASTGALALSGTATALGPGVNASGSLSLTGAGTAAAPASATGALSLSGAGAGRAPASASGALALTGTATSIVPVAGAGTLVLTATATASGPGTTAAGALSIAATSAGMASAAAAGTLALAGAAAARAGTTSTGAITLTATVTAFAHGAATGSITLTGTAIAFNPDAIEVFSANLTLYPDAWALELLADRWHLIGVDMPNRIRASQGDREFVVLKFVADPDPITGELPDLTGAPIQFALGDDQNPTGGWVDVPDPSYPALGEVIFAVLVGAPEQGITTYMPQTPASTAPQYYSYAQLAATPQNILRRAKNPPRDYILLT